MDNPFPRAATPTLARLIAAIPAILLHGPRASGKRTLAAMAVEGGDYVVLSLDDAAVREAATRDPAGFVWDLPPFVILEEVQHVPALLDVIGAEVGDGAVPGRFLLTTTSDPAGTVLPTGIEPIRVDPLSQSELGEWDSAFLDRLFAADFEPVPSERLGYELMERIVDGGFVEAVLLATPAARGDWYRALAGEAVGRDIGSQSRLRAPDLVVDLLQHASAGTGDLLNSSALAAPFSLSRPTIHDHIRRLERAHLVDLLPAWRSAESLRLVSSARLHVVDTGIAAALQGITADVLFDDRARLHPLLATFAFQELRRQAARVPDPLTFSHLRDRDGANVDVIVERADDALAGVCVRTGGTVTARDFRGLRRLRRATGDRFAAGVVLYDGVSTVAFDDRLFAVPIRSLWELG